MERVYEIPVCSPEVGENVGQMKLYPIMDAFYAELDDATARENGEARGQIREGCEYEYELPPGYTFKSEHPAISPSLSRKNAGRLRPGNYVGRLVLEVVDGAGHLVGSVELESTSVKMDYRTDYQTMLNDIAAQSAGLLMSSEEYVFQHYEIDPTADAETIYQQFAFAKSLIVSDAFDAAVTRVCTSPIKAMKTTRTMRPTTRAGRLGRGDVRQFASSVRRTPLPSGHALAGVFGARGVPQVIEHDEREETTDVPENRFVKFVLESFLSFLNDISRFDNASDQLKADAEAVAEKLECRLDDVFFRSVSRLDRLPLSSPALQRKEGYREVLRAWLMFELAAKLAWHGGEDVYKGGKRNVAVLYEYWAFFKLFEIVSRVFDFPKGEFGKLIKRDRNNLGLSLRQGEPMTFTGEYLPQDGSRLLHAQFTYNKTFSHKDNLEVQGSWTVNMRPDYTLSIWPVGLSRIEDAEKIDAVVHLHFDAKYKIDKFAELFDESGTVTGNDDSDECDGARRYKRVDLLKMHAYNDAIRRTYGSYVLYPGDKDDPKRRYHEIIPGVGAFVLRPGKQIMAGTGKIEEFIRDVVHSLQNRLSQRERTAVYDWTVRRIEPIEISAAARRIELPTYNSRGDAFIPAEEPLLVGYYHPGKWDWIKKNGYNFRVGMSRGSLGISSEELRADYILLHGGTSVTDKLFKIDKLHGPRLVTRNDMISLGYEDPSADAYLLFKLLPIEEGEALHGLRCDISRLEQYANSRAAAHPFTITFQDLLSRTVL